MANSVDLDEVAHYEPPHPDLRCLQIQLFSSLVVKELNLARKADAFACIISKSISPRIFCIYCFPVFSASSTKTNHWKNPLNQPFDFLFRRQH